MRAIKIDSHKHTVYEVDVDGHKDWKRELGNHACVAHYFDDGSIMLVDDEGLINGTDVFFEFKGAHQPFAGNGLIIGSEDNIGRTMDCVFTIDSIKNSTKFYDIYTLQLYLALKKEE